MSSTADPVSSRSVIERSAGHIFAVFVGSLEILLAAAFYVGVGWLGEKFQLFKSPILQILQYVSSTSFLLLGLMRIIEEFIFALLASYKRVREAFQ